MLKFYNSKEDMAANKEVATADWTNLTHGHFVRLRAGKYTTVEGDGTAITINSTLAEAMATKREQEINDKARAMQYGNSSAGIDYDVDYNFDKGYDGAVYRKDGHPYLQTLQGVAPADTGEMALLSAATTAIEPEPTKNTVHIYLDGKMCDNCSIYVELDAYVWYLYHYVNKLAHRMFKYDINKGLLGTLPSYQAMLTKYNLLVWQNSYIFHTNTLRESLSFELGYACTLCNLEKGMKITATITPTKQFTPEGFIQPSTALLMMYKMGETFNGSENATATTKITCYLKSDEGQPASSNTEAGYGNDQVTAEFVKGLPPGSSSASSSSGSQNSNQGYWTTAHNWTKYVVEVTISTMHQGDSYRGMFSLARGLFDESPLALPRSDFKEQLPTHTFKLEIKWEANQEMTDAIVREKDNIEVLALDWPTSSAQENGLNPEESSTNPVAIADSIYSATMDDSIGYRPSSGEGVNDD